MNFDARLSVRFELLAKSQAEANEAWSRIMVSYERWMNSLEDEIQLDFGAMASYSPNPEEIKD